MLQLFTNRMSTYTLYELGELYHGRSNLEKRVRSSHLLKATTPKATDQQKQWESEGPPLALTTFTNWGLHAVHPRQEMVLEKYNACGRNNDKGKLDRTR